MKKIIFIIGIFLIVFIQINAQQYPLHTQSLFNNFGINPAFAGSEDCIDFRAGYRLQWYGFEGSPNTAFINGHGKIKPKLLNGRDWFMGVGGRIVSDEAGPFSTLRMELAWSIHVKLGKNVYGSFGIFAGVTQSRFSLDGFDDPVVNGSQASILVPTLTPGILIYGRNFFIGFSMQDVIQKNIPNVGLETNISTHYILKASENFKISRRSDLLPSLTLRMVKGAPVGYDINVMYVLDKKYQIGVAYRNQTAVAGIIKIAIFGSFTVGYSYDYIINNIKFGTSGSHEIIIGFNTCDLNEGPVRCAAFN